MHILKNSKTIITLLLPLIGIYILLPLINFHPSLSTGDNGRDLYAIAQVAHGGIPYKDYWWVYGPLMPFYYSFFTMILGTTIKSILIGQMVLKLISGILFFLYS